MTLKLSLCKRKQALHRGKNKWSHKTPCNINDPQKTQDHFLMENPTQQLFVWLGRTDSWLVLTALNTEYCWITVLLTGPLKAVRKPIFLVLRQYLIQMSCRQWQTRICGHDKNPKMQKHRMDLSIHDNCFLLFISGSRWWSHKLFVYMEQFKFFKPFQCKRVTGK